MNSPRTHTGTQPSVRAVMTTIAAVCCCLVASSTLADPPSFLANTQQPKTNTPQPKTKQNRRRISITRSAQLPEAGSADRLPQLQPQKTIFTEDEALPERSSQKTTTQPRSNKKNNVVTTILSSLAIVIGAFLLLVWFSRKTLPRAASSLPSEAVEILGKSTLAGRQQLQLLRVGNKLILVHVTTTGAEALTEITDPAEVERLSALCSQSQAGSITATFRQVLQQFGNERTHEGFVG